MKLLMSCMIFLSAALYAQSPYVSRVIEYRPAPGQFINEESIGTPGAAQSIVGGVQGLVSLGGYGGYIVAGFDHTVMNDPANPYGVDFTVAGNAAANSSEPGIVMVMRDDNGNGLPDDTWYELKGSSYDSLSTIRNYTITYGNPGEATDIPWNDSRGENGSIRKVAAHRQPYYPSPDIFPDYPQNRASFTGTLISIGINDKNPQYILIPVFPFGYADNRPFRSGTPPHLPDDPATFDVLEGDGGNAFDIDWAVDADGKPVHLDGIDFIKIYTAVNANAGWLGEISTEVRGIVDVSPGDILSAPVMDDMPDVTVYPNPADDYFRIQADAATAITRIEIRNASGKLLHAGTARYGNVLTVPVPDYPPGVYILCVFDGKRKTTRKVIVSR